MSELVKYEAARLAIINASSVDEVKDIRDRAEAMRHYAKQAKDVELANKAAEIRIRADRRMGEMLTEQREDGLMNAGGQAEHESYRSRDATTSPTLADMGITKSMSSKAQKVASMITEDEFEDAIHDHEKKGKELTNKVMIGIVKKKELAIAKAEKARKDASAVDHNKPVIYHKNYEEFMQSIEFADVLITDPPYSTDVEDISSFAEQWMSSVLPKIKKRAYICIGAYPVEVQAYLNLLLEQSEFILDNPLIWTYRNTLGVTPRNRYNLNYQMVLHLYKDGEELDTSITNEMFSVQDINAPDGRQGDRFHTWQKPDELANRLVRHSANEDDVIIDPFACTGTFLIAAARHGCEASGCDIDPDAIEIAISRGCQRGV